jgi:glycosyltransferase involved in cell wall biosynthesis
MLVAARLTQWALAEVRIVFDLQDTPDWMWSRVARPLLRLLLRNVALVMVTSPRFESHFLRELRLLHPACPVLFVPNAPWKALFAGFEAPEPGEEMTIVCVGGLREEGPLRCLIGAVDRLRGEGFDVRLFYAGVGPYRSILDDAARTRRYLSSQGSFEYHRDIVKLYRNAHFVFACYRRAPDRRIHLACRFADAMNCGVPIIVSSDTYMAEMVTRHNVGLVAEPEDQESLAGVLRPILRDLDRWRALARNARRLRDGHTYDAYVPAFLGAYRRLLGDAER